MSIAVAAFLAAPRVQTRSGAPRLALPAQRRVRTPTARQRPLVARPAAALVELAPGIVIDTVQFVNNVTFMTTFGMPAAALPAAPNGQLGPDMSRLEAQEHLLARLADLDRRVSAQEPRFSVDNATAEDAAAGRPKPGMCPLEFCERVHAWQAELEGRISALEALSAEEGNTATYS
ncbi:hypothetical protein ABPG77_002824 [Micractinium sp. CCAP 211/92]